MHIFNFVHELSKPKITFWYDIYKQLGTVFIQNEYLQSGKVRVSTFNVNNMPMAGLDRWILLAGVAPVLL